MSRSLLPVLLLALAATSACPARHAEEARPAPVEGARPSQATVGTSCADARLGIAEDHVVATVNGVQVKASEITDQLRGAEDSALRDYCAAVSKVRAAAVEAKVDELLLKTRADAEGKTVDEYVAAVAAAAVESLTEEEVQKFYDERKRADAPPYEMIKDRVRMAVVQERQAEAVGALVKEVRAGAKIEVTLPDTRPPPVDIALGAHTPTAGPADAPVTVVEFADFQCPYCQVMARSLHEVKSRMKDRPVKFAYMHFPLSFHAQARPAAEISQCATAQGKFWPMHDVIFENMDKLDDDSLRGYAEKSGLDMSALDACLKEGAVKAQVQADYVAGEKAGVSGTPTLFINGHKYEGELDPAAIVAAIEAELSRAN
jgi:protein-disulfide isomerase